MHLSCYTPRHKTTFPIRPYKDSYENNKVKKGAGGERLEGFWCQEAGFYVLYLFLYLMLS